MSDSAPPPEGSPTTDQLETDWADIRNRLGTPMSREELAAFVLGVCDGKIFTLHHIRESERKSMAGMVFMPIFFGAFSGLWPGELEQVGTVWEYLHEAGPLSINGYPIFMSLRVICKDDWERAIKAIDKEEARRKTSVLDDL